MKGKTDADAAEQFRRRFVRFDDERRLFWAQLTGDAYALVKSAVIGRARRHDHPSAKDPDYVRFESRCADALLDLCIERGRRGGGSMPPVHGAGPVTMIVHTDLERLLYGDGYGQASIEGVGPISAEVARRVACNAGRHAVARRAGRTASTRRRCTGPDRCAADRDAAPRQRVPFPGCPCRNVTDIHHVTWASKQGPTVMSNLLTLCVAHHSRVHELGWKLDGDAQAEVRFISPRDGSSSPAVADVAPTAEMSGLRAPRGGPSP